MLKKLILIIILHINLIMCENIVSTNDGKVLGRNSQTHDGTNYVAFKGIPYAQPPVDELRFKAPQRAKKYEAIRNCTENNVMCVQMGNTDPGQNEDCLLLNIYTPNLPSDNHEDLLLPVMVYIHGGGFFSGSATEAWTGPTGFMDERVILVTINYRLGPFGFITTEDLVLPGNLGLKDLLMGLEWTHENVKYFGGDPSKITIFGPSAGGSSVTYLLLNQKVQDLIVGGISESGTILSIWSYQKHARNNAFRLGTAIDSTFTSTDSKKLLELLLKSNTSTIKSAAEAINTKTRPEMSGFLFTPVIEVASPEAFFTKPQYEMLQKGLIVKKPLIVGVTSEEALSYTGSMESFQELLKQFDENSTLLVPENMHITHNNLKRVIGNKIKNIYCKDSRFQDNLDKGVSYLSDTAFVRASMTFAELYSKLENVYFYVFDYFGQMGYSKYALSIPGAGKVSHMDEYFYLFEVFNNWANKSAYPESDFVTQKRMCKMWTNFAKHQNPVQKTTDLLPTLWPTLNSKGDGTFVYYHIDNGLSVQRNFKNDTIPAWKNLYKRYAIRPLDTM